MAEFTLDYLELPSSDAVKSSDFFSKTFVWTHVDYGGTYVDIRGAGLLFGVNADAADRSEAPMAVIRTNDIAAAEKAVVAAGGVITRKTYNFPGGQRFFF